jgi:hypothetical protein
MTGIIHIIRQNLSGGESRASELRTPPSRQIGRGVGVFRIDRLDRPGVDPNTTEYSVSFGGTISPVGAILLGRVEGLLSRPRSHVNEHAGGLWRMMAAGRNQRHEHSSVHRVIDWTGG